MSAEQTVGELPPMGAKARGAVEVIRRTGADGFQIRASDEYMPHVFVAVVTYPAGHPSGTRFDAAAATSPGRAVMRLAELLVDGGRCVNCGRMSYLDLRADNAPPLTEVAPDSVVEATCAWTWRPVSERWVRGCDGT